MSYNFYTRIVSIVLLFCVCFVSSLVAQQNKKLDENEYFLPRQISLLYIKQDLFYHPKKKKLYRKTDCVTLAIPGELRASGLSKYVGTFKYEELIAVLVKDKRAVWVNPMNPLMRFTTAQALNHSWYDCEIYQYRNPVNNTKMYIEAENKEMIDKQWSEFNDLYKLQGDLLHDVRNWQELDSANITMKPKKVKIPSKGTTKLTSIWLKVNMKEDANISFNGSERELSRIVIEAVLDGRLIPYKNDKLEEKLSIEEFKENMSYPKYDE